MLSKHNITCSISCKVNCWENAAMESFFHSLKIEFIDQHNYLNRREAKQALFEYIEVFYNQQRRHSYLKYMAPVQFEKLNC